MRLNKNILNSIRKRERQSFAQAYEFRQNTPYLTITSELWTYFRSYVEKKLREISSVYYNFATNLICSGGEEWMSAIKRDNWCICALPGPRRGHFRIGDKNRTDDVEHEHGGDTMPCKYIYGCDLTNSLRVVVLPIFQICQNTDYLFVITFILKGVAVAKLFTRQYKQDNFYFCQTKIFP